MLGTITLKMYCKDPSIQHNCVVNRRVLFIRNLTEKYSTAYSTLRWIDVIDHINDDTNKTINRSIKHKPVSRTHSSIEQ